MNPKFLIYPSSPLPLITIGLFSMLVGLFLFCKYIHLYYLFKILHLHDIIRYLTVSLSLMISCSVHPCCYRWHYFILLWLNISFYIYIYGIFFIHSSVDGHLGCFHVSALVNSTSIYIVVHVSFHIRVFIFSGYMPRSGLAGSHGNSIFSF